MTRIHRTRTARGAALVLVLALTCMVSGAASAWADESGQSRHQPKPKHVSAHHKRPAPQAKAKPQGNPHASTATNSSGGVVGQGIGRPAAVPTLTRGTSSSAAATTSPAGSTPKPTRTPTSRATSTAAAIAAITGSISIGATSSTGPTLGTAPMDGGVLLPGAGGPARSGTAEPTPGGRIGVDGLPEETGRLSSRNVAAVMALLLGTFVIALAGMVLVAGHRGRRTR